ncbi:LysR substrate-binding domain-containing protein [Streptomyces sp. NPDC005507]|uniref:LysR substrate-binding domain-containing protein n=1 Tax=Streptomyces sp. NPDC005507 TaxID=3154885 RepID=UPI0033B77405
MGQVNADLRVRAGGFEASLVGFGVSVDDKAGEVPSGTVPILGDGLDSVHLYDEPVWLAAPPDHRLASRASVSVAELREEPFVISRPGHWQRRLLDRLFAGRNLTPRIVCEGDEPAALAGLVSAGIGLTLIPATARGADISAPAAWIGIDDPACRRTLTHPAPGRRQPTLGRRGADAHHSRHLALERHRQPAVRQPAAMTHRAPGPGAAGLGRDVIRTAPLM